MIALVTGASGFLGRHILHSLALHRPEATIVGADLEPGEAMLDNVRVERLDVTDPEACRALLRRAKPSHLVHAAGVTLAAESDRAMALSMTINVDGTANILDAALATGSLTRGIVLSSGGVYRQNPADQACDEDHTLDLSSPYARSKGAAELLLASHPAADRPDLVVARVGPAYGSFERPRATRPRVSLIHTLRGALASGRVLTIGGTDYWRDWTHADDIAAALEGLLVTKTLRHRLYNVSSGTAVSARTIINHFIGHGLAAVWLEDPDQTDLWLDDAESRTPLDCTRLRADTGFAPRFGLADGLNDVIAAPLSGTPPR